MPAAQTAPRKRAARPKTKGAAEAAPPDTPTADSSSPVPAVNPRPLVTPETRHAMIAEAAYLRAEKRGFTPGHELEDWCAAEREVDALLNAETNAAAQ